MKMNFKNICRQLWVEHVVVAHVKCRYEILR